MLAPLAKVVSLRLHLLYYQYLATNFTTCGPDEMFNTPPTKSEYVTRKQIIDRKLTDAGWSVVAFDSSKTLADFDRCAIEEYPTDNGPADYALCVGGQILGVVEGKRLSVGP